MLSMNMFRGSWFLVVVFCVFDTFALTFWLVSSNDGDTL